MSAKKEVWSVGEAVRKSSLDRMSVGAATADDRGLEVVFSPGAALKAVHPLSEETLSLNPRLLIAGKDTDGTLANAKVRVRPAWFKAGSDAFTIALSARLKANADSPTIGNNSSGSTRTDLVYAQINYATSLSETVRQKQLSGGDPVSSLLVTQVDMAVTIGVVAGVAAGNPLASLPADDTVNGVYYFGLAALSIANGYAGGAINQSSITQLWTGGWLQQQRVQGQFPGSISAGAAGERSGDSFSSRWGASRRFLIPFKMLAATTNNMSPGVILDSTIDWRNRWLDIVLYYMGSAGAGGNVFPLSGSTGQFSQNSVSWSSITGGGGANTSKIYSGAANLLLGVDTSGNLQYCRGSSGPIDAANGDALVLSIHASDKIVTTF
jgi:hypothetical protein